MPTILIDLPMGRRELREIEECTARHGELHVPVLLHHPSSWIGDGDAEPDLCRPNFGVLILRPTGEFEATLSPSGVGLVPIWRAG